MNPDDISKADAIEIVVGQGAKPGGGGMLLGQKISDRVAEMRNLPKGIDQRSACRHPDWTGPDDLEIKILELREITGWRVPIYVKVAGARPYYDVTLAVKAGADAVVLDGMQGGTAATQDVFIEHVGQPTLAIIRPAVQALQDLGMHRQVQLILSGGIRSGADVAKAMALGADAVAIGSAALIALGDNDPKWESEYNKIGSTAGAYDDWHEGKDPAGITTQDPELMKRFDPIEGGRRLRNYLKVMTLEAQTIARACGKNHMHNLEPEDLVALTMEAAAMAHVPLSGTNWWSGASGSSPHTSPHDQYMVMTQSLSAIRMPARAVADMQEDVTSFVGFATWLDLTHAHSDMLAVPDPEAAIILPWDKTVAWVPGNCVMEEQDVAQAPRNVLRKLISEAADEGMHVKTGIEAEFFLLTPNGEQISDQYDTAATPCYDHQACMPRSDVLRDISGYIPD